MFGLAIGAFVAGRLMAIVGRKQTMIIGSLIGIVGVSIEMISNYWCIIVGRIIYGLSAGIYSVCVGRYIEETVPHELLTIYAPIYTCGTSVAKMVVMLIAAGLP